jgi:type IV pilus assembly protein PilW
VKKNTKGFTLAEVLVAVVIGVISVAAAFSAYNYYTKSYEAVSQKANVNSAARDALILITKDLRNAGFIGTTFLSASCENINNMRDAKIELASVSK